MLTHRPSAPRLATFAALGLTLAAGLTACQSNKPASEAPSAEASTRTVPEKGPSRPADITPPLPPSPGHTAR
jgi:hypothetical protein